MEAMQLDAEKKAEEAKKSAEEDSARKVEEAKAAAAEELRVVREQAAIRESELREVIIQQESDIKQGSEQGAVGSGEREDAKEDEDEAN